MNSHALTFRLDAELAGRLERLARALDRSRCDLVREALRRHLALAEVDEVRRRVVPFAAARGYRTDDDIFRELS